MKQKLLRWLKIITRTIAVTYLLAVVLLMIFEKSLIYFPLRYPAGNWKYSGLPIEDVHFQSADGTKLHGWYVPHGYSRAAVLFLHGNGGNLTHRTDTLERLHEVVGTSVFIFDYRGYGRSEGDPSEKGILDDARAARAWLAKREQISEEDVVLMGESLGGSVAVDLAASEGARALVLISTFSSLPDVAAYHYPIFPVRLMMRTQLNSLGKIGNYHGPLLQFHGRTDTIVPFSLGKKLFDAANEPKELVVEERHDHNDTVPLNFYEKMNALLEDLPLRHTP